LQFKLKNPSLITLLLSQILADSVGAAIAWYNHKDISDGTTFGLAVWCVLCLFYIIAQQFE
jgi:predicted transporter